VYLDRGAGRVKVLFDHNPTRVIECDLTKIAPIDESPADAGMLELSAGVIKVFELFIKGLMDEEKAEMEKKAEDGQFPILSGCHSWTL
jgi:hypothetical protein